jgi:predicted  nucleic acid-binding Zn-ribbon protein
MARTRKTPLVDTRELSTVGDRIVRLESNYESLKDEVASVHDAVDNIGDRLDREFTRIREASRPNYGLWVTIAGLLVTLFFGIGAAAYVPIWITTNNINAKAQYAQDGVNQTGLKLATMETKFAEVETQFHGVNKEIETQIAHNKENAEKNFEEIEHLRNTVNGTNGGIGLQDRVSKTEQRLDDHDRYLWPQLHDTVKDLQVPLSDRPTKGSN